MHFAGRDLYILFTRIIIEQHIVVVIITNKIRSYISGRPLADDFRVVILDTIIVNGGDYNPITYSEINDDNNLTTAGKSKII